MSNEFNEQSISGLLGSRICHDLIGPLGAIGNGVELLTMGFGEDSPEISLINDSIASALNKIRLYRIAFGDALPGQDLLEKDILAALNGFLDSGRISVVWHPEGRQSRRDIKMVFLAMMCLESALPKGGDLRVETMNRSWKITGLADTFNRNETLWNDMSAGKISHKIAPAEIHFAMLATSLNAAKRQCIVQQLDSEQSIRF